MTDTMDDAWFDRLLDEVEVTAPAEVRAEVRRLVSRDLSTTPPVGTDPSRWRRTWLSLAAAVLLIVVGLAIVASWRGSPTTVVLDSPNPTISATAPVTTMVDSEGVDDADVPAGPMSVPTIEGVTAMRSRALAALPGYTATQTNSGLRGGELSRRVTVLADGRGWAEDETGSWWSVDPSTGTLTSFNSATKLRAASAQVVTIPEGAAVPLPDLSQFLSLGGDPTAPIGIPPEDEIGTIEIAEIVRDGRPAWQITFAAEPTEITVRYEAVYVVDIATGLIVETRERKWDDTGEVDDHPGYRLADLTVTSTLPEDFPGVIPDGVPFVEMPWPSGIRRVSQDEAALQFDPPGLLIPTNPRGEVDYYLYDATLDGPSVADPTRQQVTITIRDGFDRSYIVITRFDPDNRGPIVLNEVACDDEWSADCQQERNSTRAVDVICVLPTQCGNFVGGPVDEVEAGALAGRKIRYGSRGELLIIDNGRYVQIISPDLLHAQQIANDLEPA